MKKLLFLSCLIIHVVLLTGQTDVSKCYNGENSKTDSLSDIIVLHTELSGQTNKDIERGYYKVLNIDNFNNFYLVFVEKDKIKSTIYSEKCIGIKGQKLEVDSIYYFELTCKDTIYDGTCLPTLPDVTYFEKYLGYELGELNKAKNLCGLYILEPKESFIPKREE
jgi:hypothetical protein